MNFSYTRLEEAIEEGLLKEKVLLLKPHNPGKTKVLPVFTMVASLLTVDLQLTVILKYLLVKCAKMSAFKLLFWYQSLKSQTVF